MKPEVIEKLSVIAGWYGTTAILGVYALASLSVLPADHPLSLVLSLTGALGIAWVSYRKHIASTITLNLVWALIALVALVKVWLK